MFLRQLEAVEIAIVKLFRFLFGASIPDGADGVDDLFCRQIACGSDNGLPRFAAPLPGTNSQSDQAAIARALPAKNRPIAGQWICLRHRKPRHPFDAICVTA